MADTNSEQKHCHGDQIAVARETCETSLMIRLMHKLRTPESAVAGTLLVVVLMIAISDQARAASLGLFQHVADSYLIMFLDTMSMSFVCF